MVHEKGRHAAASDDLGIKDSFHFLRPVRAVVLEWDPPWADSILYPEIGTHVIFATVGAPGCTTLTEYIRFSCGWRDVRR